MAKKRVAFLHPDLGLGGAERLVVDAALELAERRHEASFLQEYCRRLRVSVTQLRLQSSGPAVQVHIYTAFHDASRCFEETLSGSFSVKVSGSWFPRSIFGMGHALCAYIRCLLVACAIAWAAFRSRNQYDVIIADQVSAVVPILHLLTTSRVLFYCHYPDLLLAERRIGLRKVYRAPLDWIEQLTTGQADQILVNSSYTAGVFSDTFTKLRDRGIQTRVLHPACQIPSKETIAAARKDWRQVLKSDLSDFISSRPVFLSINRFERKKVIYQQLRHFCTPNAQWGLDCQPHRVFACLSPIQLSSETRESCSPISSREQVCLSDCLWFGGLGASRQLRRKQVVVVPALSREASVPTAFPFLQDVGLAVKAFSRLLLDAGVEAQDSRLVLAGGYDARLAENREYLEELQDLVEELQLSDKVWMLPSFSDQEKPALLGACMCLVYTPKNEHFGIVPLEAMSVGKPVIACNSGGPKETVLHGKTGFLCEPQPSSFAAAMRQLLASKEECLKMGENARRHVANNFSRTAFGQKLEAIVLDLSRP